MTQTTQTIRAVVDTDGSEKHVKIVASEWTPDYEGLTDAVYKLIDIDKLDDGELVGAATFDKEADKLQPSDVEITLDEHAKKYRW